MTAKIRSFAAGLCLMAATACTPASATDRGDSVNDLYRFFFVVAVVIFVLVAGLIAWSILKFRAKDDDDLPPQFHTNVGLEVLWFAIPTVIVVVLFVLSANVLSDVNAENEPGKAPSPLTIEVEGFQWGWTFRYPNDVVVRSLPQRPATIVLPVDRPITFELTSPDVVHSFYIPKFLIKRDVVPGRENRVDLTIEDTGTYRGVCAEFCGLLHARMDLTIEASSPGVFRLWLESREAASDGDA